MINRIEKKYLLNSLSEELFFRKHSVSTHFPSRTIYSIYFDTICKSDFIDGEEGTIPRKKHRLRWYNKNINALDKINSFYLEKKETLADTRKKKSVLIRDNISNALLYVDSLINNKFKKRTPVCIIKYSRKYYKNFKNIRFTIDSNISFLRCDENLNCIETHKIESKILEIKYSKHFLNLNEFIFLEQFRTRYSKYCEAIKALYRL